MEKEFFSLEPYKSNKLTRIFQIFFGVICLMVAAGWTVININTLKSNSALWITILLLICFGVYQILSGAGLSNKYIEIDKSYIKLRKSSLLPPQLLKPELLERIEIFPLSIVFILSSRKKVILRFGTTFTDIIDPVIKAVENFCSVNRVPMEFKDDSL